MAKRRSFLADRVYASLLEFVAEAEPDAPLLSERQIAKRYSASMGTVRKALARLAAENRIYKVHGKGNFVSQRGQRLTGGRGTVIFADAWANIQHPFFTRKREGFLTAATRHKLNVEILSLRREHQPERERLTIRVMQDDVVGMIYPYFNRRYIMELMARKPSLCIVSDLETTPCLPSAIVAVDWNAFGREATACQLDAGAKTVGVVWTHIETIQGAETAALLSSVKRRIQGILVSVQEGVEPVAKALLAQGVPEAMVFDDDLLAQEFCLAWKKKYSRKPLPRMAVLTNAGVPPEEDFFACFEIDGFRIGQLLADTLCNLVDNGELYHTRILLQPKRVEKNS